MKLLRGQSKKTKETVRPPHVMPVNTRISKPRTVLTYSDYDVHEITGLTVSYDYKSEGNCSISYFHDGRGNEYTSNEVKEMVLKYMKDNDIIPKESKPYGGMHPNHHFSSEDSDGCRHSCYSYEFKISI